MMAAPGGTGLVGPGGLEPPTPRLSSVCSNQLSYEPIGRGGRPGPAGSGGVGRVRTDDPLLAKQVLFQLSYDPSLNDCLSKERCSLKFTLCDRPFPTSIPPKWNFDLNLTPPKRDSVSP